MNMKQSAAIALTLIVACPIALGFMFAFSDDDVTSWEASETVNVSDLLLNSQSYITQTYSDVPNNSQLQTSVGSAITLPNYVETSATVSPYVVSSGTYANISAGWHLNAVSEVWTNNHSNRSITLLISVPVGGGIDLIPSSNDAPSGFIPDTITIIHLSDSWIISTTVNGSVVSPELGIYPYLLFTLDAAASMYTASGVMIWNNYGTSPATYASVSGLYSTWSVFNSLTLRSPDYSDVVLRVESAQIVAGSYPITENCNFDMGDYYPSSSYSLKINSVGLYGSSLTIGSESYAVTNGKITVDGSQVPVKGMSISSTLNDGGTYDLSINSKAVGTTSDPATVFFGGQWSLTASAQILEQTTDTVTQWHAGEFGFDKESFAAAGLLVCVGAFVVLGATGRMSGPKAAFLALICGGAATGYLIII